MNHLGSSSSHLTYLRARLLVAVVGPLVATGCWSTEQTQETHLVEVDPGEPCPPKEAVPTGDVDGSRCHPGTVISIDEGPHRQELPTYDGGTITLCQYLVTRERNINPGNAVCFGSGRPLLAGSVRVAPLVRGRERSVG